MLIFFILHDEAMPTFLISQFSDDVIEFSWIKENFSINGRYLKLKESKGVEIRKAITNFLIGQFFDDVIEFSRIEKKKSPITITDLYLKLKELKKVEIL